MPHPRYAEIAARTGTPYCRGIRANGRRCYSEHERGSVEDSLVHWRDRRPTESGIYRFLYLGALLRWYGYGEAIPAWHRLYLALRDVPHLAAEARVRLPRSLGDAGRAQLRAALVKVPRTEPMRKEAAAWARR